MVKKMPPVENDSDTVYDLGPEAGNFDEYQRKGHLIEDGHQGIVVLTCPEVGRTYLHEIKVPNKKRLKCRGCGKEI